LNFGPASVCENVFAQPIISSVITRFVPNPNDARGSDFVSDAPYAFAVGVYAFIWNT